MVLDNPIVTIDNEVHPYPFFPQKFMGYVLMFIGSMISIKFLPIVVGDFNLFGIVFVVIFSSIFFLPGSLLALSKNRVSVDLDNLYYREYFAYFGWKIGKWRPFKGVKVVTITSTSRKLSVNATYGGAAAETGLNQYDLNLKKDNYNKIVVATGSLKEMRQLAEKIALRTNAGIMDCSGKEKVKISIEELRNKYSY
jgi:hypothetical protein